MKKSILALCCVAMLGLGFAACDGPKTCKCTTTSGETSITTNVDIEEGQCKDMNAESTILGITTTVKCK